MSFAALTRAISEVILEVLPYVVFLKLCWMFRDFLLQFSWPFCDITGHWTKFWTNSRIESNLGGFDHCQQTAKVLMIQHF